MDRVCYGPCYRLFDNKMTSKNKNVDIVGTIPKSNIKIVERGKIDTPTTHIYDRSRSWLGTGTSIKSSGVSLVLLAQTRSEKRR